MYEIRIYRLVGKGKIRTAKIKSDKPIIGFFDWIRLWRTLKKFSIKGELN